MMNNLTWTVPRGPNGEPYIMRGNRGFCFICNVELSSPQHCQQHINGNKHIKKENESTTNLSLNPAPTITHLLPSIPVTSQREITNSRLSNRGPNGEVCDFIGPGGRCFVCGVDFTSVELAKQHLAGQKHKKRAASETLFESTGHVLSNVVSSGPIPLSVSSSGHTHGHIPLSAASSVQTSSHIPSNLEQTVGPISSGVTSYEQTSPKITGLYPPPPVSSRGPNGELYILKGNRGFCYVCNLELTSSAHAESHLSGKKHKKKSWDGFINSASTTVNISDVPLDTGTNGVLMCRICKVPFSGLENAKQHLRSEKHKNKVKMEKPDLPKQTLEDFDPEETMVMKVYQPPVPVEPLHTDINLSDNPERFDGNFLGKIGSSESVISNSPSPATVCRIQTENAVEGIQLSPSFSTNDNGSPYKTEKQNSQSENGQSKHEVHQILSEVAGNMQSEVCAPNINAGTDLALKLKTGQHNNSYIDTGVKDIPQYENMSYGMKELSKVGSKQIEVHGIDHGQQNFPSLTDNNIVPFDGDIKKCASKSLTEISQSSLVNFNSPGNVSTLPLDASELNNKYPLQHKKEFQLLEKFPQHPGTTEPGSDATGIQVTSYQPVTSSSSIGSCQAMRNTQSVLSQVKEPSLLNDRNDVTELGPTPFYFDGNSGHCFCCSVKLTSLKHANQHLFGQKHQKRANQWELKKLHNGSVLQNSAIQLLTVGLDPQINAIAKSDFYYFDGNKGFCHVCNIELTSYQHTQQHISGKPHRRSQERYCMSQTGNFYPLNCQVCGKFFTGQESAQQHFTSTKHKNKAEVMNVQVLTVVEDGRVFMKDGQIWYFCDVCKVPLNTREQFEIHKDSPKHKKECENNRSRSSSSSLVQEVVGKTILLESVHEHLRALGHYRDSVASEEGRQSAVNVPQGAMSIEANNLHLDSESQQSQHGKERQEVLDQNRHYLIYGQTPVVRPNTSITAGSGQQLNMVPENCNVSTTALVNVSLPFTNSINNSRTESDVPNVDPLTSSITFARQSSLQEISSVPIHRYANQQSLAGISPVTSEYFSAQSHFSHTPGSAGSSLYNDLWQSSKAGSGNSEGQRTFQIQSRASSVRSSNGNSRVGNDTNGNGNKSHSPLDKDNHDLANSSRESDVRKDDINEEPNCFDSVSESEGFSHAGNMMKKPKPPGQNRSRVSDRGINVLSLEKELIDDIDDEMEYRDNFNIVEPELVNKMAGLQLEASPTKPMRSDRLGFRYYCQTCNKHMNARDAYEDHVKGKTHIYNLSSIAAPVRQLPPIRKFCEDDIIDRICNMIDDSQNVAPRPYQIELVQKAMKGDSIIYLPTGTGKTLVAVLIMGLMLQENPTRPVLFLVDKVLLVMQQAHYIIKHFSGKLFVRQDTSEPSSGLVKRKLLVKSVCGGMTTKTDLPTWKHDIVVTTAAYCSNMLDNGQIRWEDFSLVVLDEVHHCNKVHPYHKLMSKYHCVLPESSRAKVLGLTASPAGKSTVEQTYNMLKNLLTNLGGATVAVVEAQQEDLNGYQSTAQIRAINVPMSSKEVEFKRHLLEYFILCYAQLASMTRSLKSDEPPCSYFQKALKGDNVAVKELANDLIKDPEPLMEILSVIYSAECIVKDNGEYSSRFDHLRLHICNLLLVIPEIGSGTDMEELLKTLSPSTTQEFTKMGLPCEQTYERVRKFAEDGNSDLTMFNKLVETLQKTEVINWSNTSSRALVLVRERKLARQYCHRLRTHPMVLERQLRVGHIVGHGKGAKDGGMDVKKQRKVFDNHEKFHILVATSIMEEGIDIQALQLVVCMNPPSSLRALVQMRGRARRKGSHFVVLCSSEEEVDKLKNLEKQEMHMQEAAKKCLEEERSREN